MRQKHRERFLDAIDLREPDMVPITDLGFDPPIIEAIVGKKLSGFSLVSGAEDNAWETSLLNKVALSEACLKMGFDAIPAVSDYSLCSRRYKPKKLDENTFIDEWGRVMQTRVDTKTTWWIKGTVETEDEIRNYEALDPEEEGRFEMIEKIVDSLREKDAVVMGQAHSGWHMAFQIRGGIDKMIIDMYRRPNMVHKFMDKVAKACLGLVKIMIEGGVEVVFMTDDYADNRSPFMTVDQFREFELPNIRKLVDHAKGRGVPVLKHSDGNIHPILEDIINSGIEGIHPIEPGAMNLEQIKKEYGGRICILGNVDCRYVLPFGSEEEVRKDVRRCVDAAGGGGGYVLTSSNSLHANCRVANIYTMIDEARRYGRYPLKNTKPQF